MRGRLVWGTIGVITTVLLALGVPGVILLRRAAEQELRSRLNGEASAISTAIADDLLRGRTPSLGSIAALVAPGDEVVITDAAGGEVAHLGKVEGTAVGSSVAGPAGTTVTARAARSALDRRTRGPLIALAAFAAASIALGAALAWVLARRLSRPLEQLASTATRLGNGDFSAPVPPPCGIDEIDGIGAALGTSAQRLDDMLTAERSFTGDATHQLRTGLTGIGLQLELLGQHDASDVRQTADEAQRQVDRMRESLDELLALARGGSGRQRVGFDLAALAAHHCNDWRLRFQRVGRVLIFTGVGTEVAATPGFAGQIIDVLLDNALRHSSGTVRVDVDAGAVTVVNDGRVDGSFDELCRQPADPSAVHGRGLPLARRLARADGGEIDLLAASPPTFRLRYP